MASKLKRDGGDETSHSSVRPRQGFHGATGPFFHDQIMLKKKIRIPIVITPEASPMNWFRPSKRES